MKDLLLSNIPENNLTIQCLDHGFVRLVDCLPRISYDDKIQTLDYAIVQAARVSTGGGYKTHSEDENLIRYLIRNAHTSPLEMIEFKFHMKMPIFVARQMIRHRMASVNEYSGRYSVIKDSYYIPHIDRIRGQGKINKQGSEGEVPFEDKVDFIEHVIDSSKNDYQSYENAIKNNISREISRIHLGVNFYTEWYWKMDLHNLLHMLSLRCDSHAQYEIQVYGNAILKLIEPLVPYVIKAWNDYHPRRNAILLTAQEIEAIRNKDTSKLSATEKYEFEQKLQKSQLDGLPYAQ